MPRVAHREPKGPSARGHVLAPRSAYGYEITARLREQGFEDVADLFEQAAADGTPIREIVGEDPVEFVDALVRNYPKGGYVDRERERLTSAIDRVADGTP